MEFILKVYVSMISWGIQRKFFFLLVEDYSYNEIKEYILFLLKYKYIVVCKYVVINGIGMLIENRLQIREKVIKEQIEYFLEFIMFLG